MSKEEFSDLDNFRKEVFEYVHYLESLNNPFEEIRADEGKRGGCLGVIVKEFAGSMLRIGRRKYRQSYDLVQHERRAIRLLQDEEIKSRLCSVLAASDVLPLDVAAKITPPLYELANVDPNRVPKEPIFFAVIARKIAKDEVLHYCNIHTDESAKGP